MRFSADAIRCRMSDRAHWERMHTTKAPDSVSWFEPRPEHSLALIQSTGLGLDARILDVGSGASRLVDLLLEAGYERLGVLDISGAALARVQARLGDRATGVEWFEADVRAFTSPHRWDLWHDRAVFHFLTHPEDRARYLNVLRTALEPGGYVVIATFGPEGPTRCSGLPVRRYGLEELQDELGAGFSLVRHLLADHETPGGARQQFLYAVFRDHVPAT